MLINLDEKMQKIIVLFFSHFVVPCTLPKSRSSPCFSFRVAEEVIFGSDNVTTGASNDFMQVSRVARQMVERFGFSKKIGQVAIGGPGGNPFLGQQVLFMLLIVGSCGT